MYFEKLEELPHDPILGIKGAFLQDPRSQKVDLGVGNYKNERLQEEVMEVVKEAETVICKQEKKADYLPIDGSQEFLQKAGELVFQEEYVLLSHKLYAAQSVGGTGALRVLGELLVKLGGKEIYLCNPTWPNHHLIFEKAKLKIITYRYLEDNGIELDFKNQIKILQKASENSIVVFHASCHNPTGIDPSRREWEELLAICQHKRLFPIFDLAYQGLGIAVAEDAWPVRLFAKSGIEMATAVTFSKNFSLYSQRVGSLFILGKDEEQKRKIASHVKQIIRSFYSNPPSHGAMIVTEVLQNEKMRRRWELELAKMRERMQKMREALSLLLSSPQIMQQKGMFSLLPLTVSQVKELQAKYGIYLLENGRINIGGLNNANVQIVADAIKKVGG